MEAELGIPFVPSNTRNVGFASLLSTCKSWRCNRYWGQTRTTRPGCKHTRSICSPCAMSQLRSRRICRHPLQHPRSPVWPVFKSQLYPAATARMHLGRGPSAFRAFSIHLQKPMGSVRGDRTTTPDQCDSTRKHWFSTLTWFTFRSRIHFASPLL